MATPARGCRKIVVDGEPYLWRIRQKTNDESDERIGIQHAKKAGSTLVESLRRFRPSECVITKPVVPSEVAEIIRIAIKQGWLPNEVRPQFLLNMEEFES